MLNKIKSEFQDTAANSILEQQQVGNLGLVNQDAANTPHAEHSESVERRLRRVRRNHRNAFSSLGLWRASIG